MSVQIARKHFNVTEFYRMATAGVFSEDDRVELIEGEIIEMSPIGSRHASCVGRLTELFGRVAGVESIVWVQNPVHLDEYSEPLPDIALLKRRDDFYAGSYPAPADVLLLIEVSDTSVEYDREIKVPLYAGAKIPEVWLVNLPADVIEIYRQPVNGRYMEIQQAKRGESVTLSMIPTLLLDANSILG
ncbi:MAG: hypothetical protein AUG51_02220 [Acidobacteria bacterium 13_1_20CM_3_53_8]|nr:MAG: hypothetical protein AUG51_02220 [Acidobacteria bacterium 13_1_20CM_3_53_8]